MRAEDVTHTPERSCRPQAAIRPVSGTNPAPLGQRPQLSSPILLTGSTSGRAPTSVGHPASRRPRGRSSAGTKRLRTPSGSKIMICRAISTSLRRALHPPPGSREHRPSDPARRRFRPWPSHPARAGTQQPPDHPPASLASPPASRIRSAHPMSRSLRSVKPPSVLNASTTDRGRDLKNWMRRRNLRFRWLCRVIVVINAAPFSGLFCCSPQGGATRVGR